MGIAQFELEIWNAVAAPVGLPKPVISKLATLISETVRTADMRQRLFNQGWQVVGSSPEGLAHRMRVDASLLGGVIARLGIRNE